MSERVQAIGRRKESSARVWLSEGSGKITVNDREIDNYFGREVLKMIIRQPLRLTKTEDRFDISVNVEGGGLSGQAGAIKLGISRALCIFNPEFRKILKKAGLLTRDPRERERKKYGQPGPRKRFQYSKR
jgi:small subunit ribosomal protein S9